MNGDDNDNDDDDNDDDDDDDDDNDDDDDEMTENAESEESKREFEEKRQRTIQIYDIFTRLVCTHSHDSLKGKKRERMDIRERKEGRGVSKYAL